MNKYEISFALSEWVLAVINDCHLKNIGTATRSGDNQYDRPNVHTNDY
jgi:hypothetical protein